MAASDMSPQAGQPAGSWAAVNAGPQLEASKSPAMLKQRSLEAYLDDEGTSASLDTSTSGSSLAGSWQMTEEVEEDDVSESEHPSDEGTALAPRPSYTHQYNDEEHDESDLTTPGLHTADAEGMAFPDVAAHSRPAPSPVPFTLANYLASTLSSPKTRSHSSSSLASFPTDLLSDISRQDSLGIGGSGLDTDEDGASEFDSDRGDGHRPYTQGIADKTVLVMPRLDSGHASAGHNRRSRQRVQPEYQHRPHIIIVGGSELDRKKAIEAFRSTASTSGTSTPLSPISAPSQSRERSPSPLSQECLELPTTASTSSTAYTAFVEAESNIGGLPHRVLQPFSALLEILNPNILLARRNLALQVLPSIMEELRVVDAVIWLSHQEKAKQQHEAAIMAEVSSLVTVLPVRLDSREIVLYEDSVQLAGAQQLAEDGHLHSMKQASTAPVLSTSLARAMSQSQIRRRTVNSFLDWSQRQGQVQTGMPLSRQNTLQEGSLSEDVISQSVKSSHSGHLTVSTAIADSLVLSSNSGMQLRQRGSYGMSAIAAHSPMPLPGSFADPLHVPSLFRLLGLNLVASFVGLKQRIFGFFRLESISQRSLEPTSLSSETESTSSQISSRSPSRQSARPPTPASYKPSFFCCNRGTVTSREDWSECKAYRCRGLVIASFAIGIALFFC